MQTAQIVTFIHTIPMFHWLEREQLEQLARAATIRHFAPGDLLQRQGEEAHELVIVVAGELQAFIGEEDVHYERELMRFYPGDYFGMVGLLLEDRFTSSVRAVEDGTVLVITREKVDELFENSPKFGRAVCRSLAGNFRDSISKIPAIPFERLDTIPNLEDMVRLLPPRISAHCRALVVRRDADRVRVALVNPTDERSCNFIKEVLHDHKVEFAAISEEDYERHASRLFGRTDSEANTDEVKELFHINSHGEHAPIAETGEQDLLPDVFAKAIRSRASDVHIEPGDPAGRIRLRLDGRLATIEDHVPPDVMRQINGRVKVMADLDIANARQPQDGRFMVESNNKRTEFRVSVLPCQGGEKIVLRLVAPDTYLENLANLFVSEPVAMLASDVFRQPSGLVLVTGPTGSGKTTTLYAALNMLNLENQTSNIVTIEDPVEYNLEYATQHQVDRAANVYFKDILRSALRQDPDIILIGEVRDAGSAAIAVEAATTGHFVLSSLHTDSAIETIVRLRNLEVRPYLLASALKGVISQKLVPRLSPAYSEEVQANDPVVARLQELGILDRDFDGSLQRLDQADVDFPKGEAGRVAAFEILSITNEIRDLIDRSAPLAEFEAAFDDACFFSLARYCRLLLTSHQVAPEHIERIFPKRPGKVRNVAE